VGTLYGRNRLLTSATVIDATTAQVTEIALDW
jgi:hypothetical protein